MFLVKSAKQSLSHSLPIESKDSLVILGYTKVEEPRGEISFGSGRFPMCEEVIRELLGSIAGKALLVGFKF